MTNLDSILKSRDMTLPTKVHLVKAMVFSVVMYGCESWTINKAEHRRIGAFELWCWGRLLRIPWTTKRSNQSILKEISPEYSSEGLMLKLKLQYSGHMMWRAKSLEKALMLRKIEGRRRQGRQGMRWLDGITNSMDTSFKQALGFGDAQGIIFWAASKNYVTPYFRSVQSLSHVRLFTTPWTAARQASLSITNSQSLPKLMSIELVMPSHHPILCRPLLLLPSICLSVKVFSNESALHIMWPEYWSFSFHISPSNEHSGLISLRMDWLDLLAVQGTLNSLL